MSKFLINQLTSNVVLNEGKVMIPINGWVEITDAEAQSEVTADIIRRGWVKLVSKKPEPAQVFVPSFEIAEPAVKGSKAYPKKKEQEVTE